MPSIRILRFAGLLPEISPRLLQEDHAQMAHNTLLWDGELRPMPIWTAFESLPSSPKTIYPSPGVNAQYAIDYALTSAEVAWQEPFIQGTLFGINAGVLNYRLPGASTTYPTLSIPSISGVSQIVTNQFQSVYPIPRTYAITILSGNMESTPFVFPSIGRDGDLFEGDVVTLQWTINNTGINATSVRLYRTIPGFDTSEQIGNPKETAFHLVTQIAQGEGSFTYVDALPSNQILSDRLMTEQFLPIDMDTVKYVGQTESGWLVAYGTTGSEPFTRVQVSERFLWHAWPLQNRNQIPEKVTDATVFYDEIFFGTTARPYHMRVTFSDNVEVDSLNIDIRPFPDYYACVPGTMVTTNSGAMYASFDGLVALEVNESTIVTKKLTNPGDDLLTPNGGIRINLINSAIWWNGSYIGLSSENTGYLYTSINSHNNQFPLQRLITFTSPAGTPGPNLVVPSSQGAGFGSGIVASWGNKRYSWPLPGYGYEIATKLTYTWKSKKFVMAGATTFAAAKVVNSEDGALTANFYGDGNLIYSKNVTDSLPFRIPHNHDCIVWEIELVGKASVQEVHLATSMRDLIEETGHP